MAENESTLFRKSTLERVSSPDQLNEYIKVTNPSLVVMLLGVFSILIAGIVWIFSGVIPKTVDISGVVATSKGNTSVYCYVPIGTSKRLTEGMDVQISPDYANREEYGYIKGKVSSVGSKVVTEEYLMSKFSEPQIVYPVFSEYSSNYGNLVEIELSMDEWSSSEGAKIDINEGTLCQVSAIVGGTRPYELIFN